MYIGEGKAIVWYDLAFDSNGHRYLRRDKVRQLKLWSHSALQGCEIFLGTTYQNGKNMPNYHTVYQTVKEHPNMS
jgi:hypothetical protein